MFLKTNLDTITLGEFENIGSTKVTNYLPTDDGEIHLYNLDDTREHYFDILIKNDKRIDTFDKDNLWFLIAKTINEKINEYISYRVSDMIIYYLPQDCGITAFFTYKNYAFDFLKDAVYKFNGISLSKNKIGRVEEVLKALNIKENDLEDIIVFFNQRLIKDEITNGYKKMRALSKDEIKEQIEDIVTSYLSMDCFDDTLNFFAEEIEQEEIDEHILKQLTYDEINKALGGGIIDSKIQIN